MDQNFCDSEWSHETVPAGNSFQHSLQNSVLKVVPSVFAAHSAIQDIQCCQGSCLECRRGCAWRYHGAAAGLCHGVPNLWLDRSATIHQLAHNTWVTCASIWCHPLQKCACLLAVATNSPDLRCVGGLISHTASYDLNAVWRTCNPGIICPSPLLTPPATTPKCVSPHTAICRRVSSRAS